MKTIHRRQGEDIIIEGDDTNFDAYIILSGEVKVHKNGQFITTLGENSLFGEIGLVDQRPRTATCTASSKTVTLGVVTRTNYARILKHRPEALNPILKLAVERLRTTLDLTMRKQVVKRKSVKKTKKDVTNKRSQLPIKDNNNGRTSDE
ncbi:MAG: cyclic nucleotide-binding domain-containing protein [Euryarchaeota archaeon]|jgi:CRP-like cAMP-binding protein|nr:cyclic nucleotide-binding domain-containing protein [Euryarchaeota archaeon]